MITKLVIENHKTIEHIDITFDKQLSILQGYALSGKTTILHAVHTLRELIKTPCRSALGELKQYSRFNNKKPTTFDITLKLDKVYRYILVYDKYRIHKEHFLINGVDSFYRSDTHTNYPKSVEKMTTVTRHNELLLYNLKYVDYQPAEVFIDALLNMTFYTTNFYDEARWKEKLVSFLANNTTKHQLLMYLRDADNNIIDMTPYELRYANNFNINLDIAPKSLLAYLYLYVITRDAKSVIWIDDYDNDIDVQQRWYFEDTLSNSSSQVIVTTKNDHSDAKINL